MGVRGLQTYIENQCPDACKTVSIKNLAKEHKIKYDCEPCLVVDGMSLINKMYAKSLEWIYGGQWMQFIKQLEEFIALFHSIGVQLVFFFDGTVCASKRKEWVSRRVNKYREISQIFSEIELNHCEPDHKLFKIPTALGSFTRFALKELGAEVYQTVREADEVIADYAFNNQNVFAILSQDSDFIIYNTKLYLSLLHLDLNNLTTVLYDRNYFALHYLRLSVSQLPLFACLVGNDIIPFDKLRHFHKYLSNYKTGRIFLSDIAQNLASIIGHKHWTGNLYNQDELNSISMEICRNCSLSQIIYDGLKSYSVGMNDQDFKICINLHPNMQREIFDRHCKCINTPFIYNLLYNLQYESSEVLEDNRRLPSGLVYRKLRQRCYGIVLSNFATQNYANRKNEASFLVKEWCAYQGNLMEEPEYIEALPIKLPDKFRGMPLSIENLWFQSTNIERKMLFWSILDIPMELDLLLSLPEQFISFACLLSYLISYTDQQGPMLSPLDVAVFIIQAVWKKDVKELEELPATEVNALPINLSTLFMRGVCAIHMILNVCGNPFPMKYAMPWRYFDGKLFHYLYNKAGHVRHIQTICQQKKEVIDQFYYLLPIITRNTCYDVDRFNWKNIFKDFDMAYVK